MTYTTAYSTPAINFPAVAPRPRACITQAELGRRMMAEAREIRKVHAVPCKAHDVTEIAKLGGHTKRAAKNTGLILEAIRKGHSTTGDIAKAVGMSVNAAYKKLSRMNDLEQITKETIHTRKGRKTFWGVGAT